MDAAVEGPQINGEAVHPGIAVLQSLVDMHLGDGASADDKLNSLLRGVKLFASDAPFHGTTTSDPVLEAECYVLLAKFSLLKGNGGDAIGYLKQWNFLKQFVQNYYLNHLADLIRHEAQIELAPPFGKAFNFEYYREGDPKTVKNKLIDYLAEYEKWLLDAIQVRKLAKSDEEAAKIYGAKRTTFVRRLIELYGRERPVFSRKPAIKGRDRTDGSDA